MQYRLSLNSHQQSVELKLFNLYLIYISLNRFGNNINFYHFTVNILLHF